MKKPILKPAERQILKVLLEHDYFLTTREVANLSKVHWNTAHIYLVRFHNRRWVRKLTTGNREMWKVILRGKS